MFFKCALALGCTDFGIALSTFAFGHSFGPLAVMPSIMHPAALHPGLAVNLVQGRPEPHGTFAHSQFRGDLQPPAFRFADLRFRSSSNSRQLWVLSRKPSIRPSTSLLPHSSAPIITREPLKIALTFALRYSGVVNRHWGCIDGTDGLF